MRRAMGQPCGKPERSKDAANACNFPWPSMASTPVDRGYMPPRSPSRLQVCLGAARSQKSARGSHSKGVGERRIRGQAFFEGIAARRGRLKTSAGQFFFYAFAEG